MKLHKKKVQFLMSDSDNHCGSCDGVCYKTDSFDYATMYKCIAQSTYDLCKGNIPNYWIMVACFIAVNLIMYIAAVIHGGYKSSTCTLIVSIVQNAIFCVFILSITCVATFGGYEPAYVIPIPLSIIATITLNVMTFCSCRKKTGRDVIFQKKSSDDDDETQECDIQTYIAKAHFNPPLIKIKGVASYSQQYGGKTRINFLKYKDYVPYLTWRSDSSPEPVTESGLTIVKVENNFTFTEGLKTVIGERKKYIASVVKQSGCEISNECVVNKVHNVKKEKTFGSSCVSSFLNSCFGKFIFVISHICGLSAAFENLYGLTTTFVTVTTSRTLSDINDLPVQALCHDPKAAECDTLTQMPMSFMPQTQLMNQLPMGQQGVQMMPMQPQQMMQMSQGPMQIQPGMPCQGMIPMQPTQYQAYQPMPQMTQAQQTQQMQPMIPVQQNQQNFVIPDESNPYNTVQ